MRRSGISEARLQLGGLRPAAVTVGLHVARRAVVAGVLVAPLARRDRARVVGAELTRATTDVARLGRGFVGRLEPELRHGARLRRAAGAADRVAVAGDDEAARVHLVERDADLLVGRAR